MPVDGNYKVDLITTIGTEDIQLTLKTDGDSLSGTMEGHFGQQSFDEGTVKGNDVSWSVKLQSPMGEMILNIKGTLDGDELSGEMQLGDFRPSAFKGTRS